ncbi:MAG: hypothetical protein GY856_34100 [bacterium]|nr:hypothetical protein [bacterium]
MRSGWGEIHLHPRAQVALASVLAAAAGRGVRVVAETHSALLLLAVQTLVARGELPAAELILHWFERGEDGATRIRTAELDDAGSFGDWPEDFTWINPDCEEEDVVGRNRSPAPSESAGSAG